MLPNNDVPMNRASQTQQTTKKGGDMLYVLASQVDSKVGLYLIGVSREEYAKETDGEVILCHEPAFGKVERDYNPGEDLVAAVARTASADDESAGAALERLLTQVFLLGVAHGTETERERISVRVFGTG
ncbi:MAG: hypothetical protein WCV68_03060 [Candidatus Paceibacterota bacterium]